MSYLWCVLQSKLDITFSHRLTTIIHILSYRIYYYFNSMQ